VGSPVDPLARRATPNDRQRQNARNNNRVLLAVSAVLGFPIFVALVLLAGVGIAALLGRRGSTDTWIRWGNIGQTFESVNTVFSGLAFVALVVTFMIQYQELRMQRLELQMQRAAVRESNGELRRSADADLRRLHVELIRMSINDPQLAAVWPEFGPDLSEEQNRQYLYANLIFQHVRVNLQIGDYSTEEARRFLRYLFSSPLMRAYWQATQQARSALVPGTSEHEFSNVADEICRELEADATKAGRRVVG
jgi:hypothetical protein